MGYAHGEQVVVVRAVGVDKMGDTLPGQPTETPVPGCAVASGSSLEPVLVGREQVVVDYQVFLPAGTDVRATDRLRIRGDLCDVVGHPVADPNPYTGWNPGVLVNAVIGKG